MASLGNLFVSSMHPPCRWTVPRQTLLDPRATYTHYHIVANQYHVSNATPRCNSGSACSHFYLSARAHCGTPCRGPSRRCSLSAWKTRHPRYFRFGAAPLGMLWTMVATESREPRGSTSSIYRVRVRSVAYGRARGALTLAWRPFVL